MDEYTCPVCAKTFTMMKSLNSHLKMAKNCSHWGKGKRREAAMDLVDKGELGDLNILSDPQHSHSISEDLDPIEVMEDWLDDHRDAFHFTDDVAIGQAGPGPSTTSRFINRTLDEDEDARVEDIHPTAGMVIRMDKHLHYRWQKLFKCNEENQNNDQDVDMGDGARTDDEQSSINPYAPFASELEWRVARWAVQDSIGHKSLDRLLAIPGVCYFFLFI